MKWQKSALIARSADNSWEFQRYFCQKRHPEYWKLQTILPIWQEAREAMRALSCGHSKCGGAGGPSSAGQGVPSAHSQHSQKTSLFQKVLQRMGRWRRPSAWLCTLIKMTLGFSCSYSHSSELHVILHLGIPSVQPSPRQPPASSSPWHCAGVVVTAVRSNFYTLLLKSEPGNTYWTQKWICYKAG